MSEREPALSSGVLYSLMTKADAARWYTPGAFESEPVDQPYNGWSNYKTWATDLWLTNNEESYDAARAAVARGGPDALRAYVLSLPEIERALRGTAPTSGLAADLYEDEQQNARETRDHGQNARETRDHGQIVRDALDKINWQEIAASLQED